MTRQARGFFLSLHSISFSTLTFDNYGLCLWMLQSWCTMDKYQNWQPKKDDHYVLPISVKDDFNFLTTTQSDSVGFRNEYY